MRKRRVLADLNACVAGESDAAICLRDQIRDCVLRHTGLKRFVDRLVDRERRVIREPHQRKLVRILDHAAAGDDGCAADDLQLWRSLCDAVGPDELRRFLDAEDARAGAAIPQAGRDESVRAFVLVPGADVRAAAAEWAERDLFACAILFERRTDEKRFALYGDHTRK